MHFIAKALSNVIFLEARWLPDNNDKGLNVKDIIDLPYHVIESVPVIITPSLEIVITKPIELKFENKTMFYCVFYHQSSKSVCIPNWFPMVMWGEPTTSYTISSKNIPSNSIAGIQMSDIPSFNKFDILVGEN